MRGLVLRILLVEDDEAGYCLASHLLGLGSRARYEITWVRTHEAAVEIVQREQFDACLLDFRLGERTGLDFLAHCNDSGYSIPIILLTGVEDLAVDEMVLRSGAADSLVKSNVTTHLLERSICYALERTRHLTAVRRSEQLLSETIDSLDDHLAILDAKGEIIATNQAWKNFGRSNGIHSGDAAPGANYLEVCRRAAESGDVEAAETLGQLTGVLAGAGAGFSRICQCSSPGKTRWFRMHVYPLQHGHGAVVTHKDVTSRFVAEQHRAASERRFRALIENSADHLILLDSGGYPTYVSPSVERVFGVSEQDLLRKHPMMLIHKRDVALGRRAFSTVIRFPGVPVTVEIRVRERSGHWLWLECSMNNLLEDDDVRAVVINARDITARKEAELALRESEARYRELFSCAMDLVYYVDLDGRIVWLNPAAERALGYTEQEALGMSVETLVAPEYRELILQARREKLEGCLSSTVYELEMLSRTGQRLALEANTTILYHAGKPAGILGIGRDITERRRMERFEQGRRAVLEGVAENRPLPHILEQLAALVEQQYAGSSCIVRLLSGDALPIIAATSSLTDSLRDAIRVLGVGSASPASSAVERRQPILLHDIHGCKGGGEWAHATCAAGFRACWVFPLISASGQILGTLEVCRDRPGLPEQDDQTLDKAVQLAALTIQHRQFTEQLAYQAQHDPLTGLPNRPLFEDRLQQLILSSRQRRQRVAVLFIDLDNFKHVNDSFGHHAGDELLKQATDRLRLELLPSTTLARLGGDEFSITTVLDRRAEDPNEVAQRVLKAFRAPFCIEGHEIYITASIGVSVYPRDAQTAEALLQRADTAMYRAKMRGKNVWQSFSADIQRVSSRHLQLQSDLRGSVERGEFCLVYQPQLNLESGKLAGFEVLLRWHHPTLGEIPPSTFVPLAEESGLIVPIGSWVLAHACRQGMRWQAEGLQVPRLGINVSAVQFGRRGWLEAVSDTLSDVGFAPHLLDLELTETVVMHNVTDSVRAMKTLRNMGIGISVDDFGTGYSSLSYLQRLPIDRLKIDVSFVQDIKANTVEAPLVRAIIGLAHSLGIRVVAEGVETRHQMSTLRRLGCDEVQGYYVGRPLAASDAAKWLKRCDAAGSLVNSAMAGARPSRVAAFAAD